MLALGVPNLPSDRTMDDIDKELQRLCGIWSIQYQGALGHPFYINDLAAIISQEMHNPSVRPHLRFLPEDAGNELSEAYQAQRWLTEQDPKLLTPVHRITGRDFYTLEPALLRDGNLEGTDGIGWAVQTYQEIEISETNLLLSYPEFKDLHKSLNCLDPSKIIADKDTPEGFANWTKTNPLVGNQWIEKSNGKQVSAFPLWLHCDDTSGNLSKKWNKHNSFLFTPAGLPRHLAHKEKNVHFLCTSNIAPPLEMLDGIADQLEKAQKQGIWAWDSELQDIVLLIPSVHALLGDNPMQSEFSCHIGFAGRLFCRNCWASEKVEGDEEGEVDPEGGYSSDVVKFVEASQVGGGAAIKRMKTASGIKDNYQAFFAEQLQAIAMRKGLSKEQREREIIKLRQSFPLYTTSPVWRLKGLDPHQDTPVEVLHVVLLVVQAGPFVLQGLLTNDQLEAWKALSALKELKDTIDHFLNCTCRLTPRWFNKPKFHVLLHLPDHIRRFGPVMLFATEAFKLYNAII
ncbi:hypothetical protein EV359DRAFT_75674 [Lentinula novae-zelandiae]|nr:hypothetical protein EV359DRAFT_75674 [Lentinula novae-zelandiae]